MNSCLNAGCLRASQASSVAFAAPLAAQTTLPPISLGARVADELRAHLAGRGGRHRRVRARQRAPLRERAGHRKIKFMFNTEYDGSVEQDRRARRRGAVRDVAEVQHLDGPFPAAQRSREPLRPVLRASLGRLHRRHPERPSLRLPGPRQRRRLLGRLRQGEGLGRASSTAQSATGDPEVLTARRACRSISGTRKPATT